MEPDQGETNTPERADALPEHRLKSRSGVVSVPLFERAILKLVPTRRRADMIALLGGKAKYPAIQKWRQGKRTPAPWAMEMLAIECRRRKEDWASMHDLIAAAPRGRGRDWRRTKK